MHYRDGKMECNKCHNSVDDSSRFCPSCGSELASEEKNTQSEKRWEAIAMAVGVAIGLWWIWPSSSSSDNAKDSTAEVTEYPRVILKKDSIVCYKRDDWNSMVQYGVDRNFQAMNSLVSTGRCYSPSENMTVRYLDPVQKEFALIQLPSGKGAYSMRRDLMRIE